MRTLISFLLLLVPLSSLAPVVIVGSPLNIGLGPPLQLLVHLPLNEGSGTTASDISGNANNFTLTGATWVTGENGSGSAVNFNGTNDFMASTATVTFGTKIITVCAWIYWNTFADDNRLAWELATNVSLINGTFNINPNSALSTGRLTFSLADNTIRTMSLTRPSVAGAWHHWAVVYDNSTAAGLIKVYLDSIAQTLAVVSNSKTGTSNFRTDKIYLFSRGGFMFFGAGRIDDFRIYKQELSVGQINFVMLDAK